MSKETISGRPAFSPDQVTECLRDWFEFEAAGVKPLPSERDQNFLVTDGRSDRVLKIANADADLESISFQNDLLRHLQDRQAESNCGFQFPSVFPNKDGNRITHCGGDTDNAFAVRLVDYLPGIPFANYRPHGHPLRQLIGKCLGNLTASLQEFSGKFERHEFDWDLDRAAEVVAANTSFLDDHDHSLIQHYLEIHERIVSELKPGLRRSLIHNDANDHNLIIQPRSGSDPQCGLIDFGDVVHSQTINELATALAYLMLSSRNPIADAAHTVAGFHAQFPLTDEELKVLFPLACSRLCVSLCMSARQSRESDDPYLLVTADPARNLLEQLRSDHPRMVEAQFRQACQLPAFPQTARVTSFLKTNRNQFANVVGKPTRQDNCLLIDLSVATSPFELPTSKSQMKDFEDWILHALEHQGLDFGIGRYNEPRQCYLGDQFQTSGDPTLARTIHIGLDLFAAAGQEVFAPLAGRVHSFQVNDLPFDYGPTIILEHQVQEQGDLIFYTLYGHLDRDSLDRLSVGQEISQGQSFARLGTIDENGHWPAHLHFQLMVDLLDQQGDFPGVGDPGRRELWSELCPDPNLILGIEDEFFDDDSVACDQMDMIQETRRQHLNPSLSLSYSTPIHVVRGRGQYLIDDHGRTYLDMVNNVCHVGHANAKVVAAIHRQARILNTNTRYCHQNITQLAQRLVDRLPEPLSVCFFVNSGSEANDLALRLARNFSGRQSIVCLEGAYHGSLSSLIDISPYKFNSAGGQGCPPLTILADMPDPFRGKHRVENRLESTDIANELATCSALYLEDFDALIRNAVDRDLPPAAFIAEPLMSCGGQIVFPPGYLAEAFKIAQRNGAVTIADEVQIGFGRMGEQFWGFELEGAIPDIVTMGKPIANGHPMGAVVTTNEIAAAFNNGMEYFNTFGGNPVSCAAALAVLDEIEHGNLQDQARRLGNVLINGIQRLKTSCPAMGDVRGQGLFIGIEFVIPGSDRKPDAGAAKYVVQSMKELDQILLSTDGPDENVIKIKPPLVIERSDIDRFLAQFEKIIADLPKL